jgi:hypothetical protein
MKFTGKLQIVNLRRNALSPGDAAWNGSHAKCDQVLFRIIAAPAAKILVVHLQAGPGAATLAPPAVVPEHLLPELSVQLGTKPLVRSL